MKKIMQTLTEDIDVFGVSVYGDGATVRRMPLLNLMAAGVHNPQAVLDVVDCTERLQEGGKKDGEYVANLFLHHIQKLEYDKKKQVRGVVDLAFFDGASNMQKAGAIMAAKFPRITCIQGAEHVVSLFFNDIFKVSVRTVAKRFGTSTSATHHCCLVP